MQTMNEQLPGNESVISESDFIWSLHVPQRKIYWQLKEQALLNASTARLRAELQKCPVLCGEIGSFHGNYCNGDPIALTKENAQLREQLVALKKERDDFERLADLNHNAAYAMSAVLNERDTLREVERDHEQLVNYLTAKLGTKGEHGVFETIDNVAAKLFSPAV